MKTQLGNTLTKSRILGAIVSLLFGKDFVERASAQIATPFLDRRFAISVAVMALALFY